MSLYSWFSKKTSAQSIQSVQNSGFDAHGMSKPPMSANRLKGRLAPLPHDASDTRKTERIERREQLYGVVRDAMTRVGILSASYKYKVLSLDPHGRQYLIMMDLSNQAAGEPDRLAEIESVIAQSAKSRHEILVTAVYWRVNAKITVGLTAARPGSGAAVSRPAPLTARHAHKPTAGLAAAVSVSGATPRYEPLQADEVIAFKNALATAAPATLLVASGEIVKSQRRNPVPPPEFENTELADYQEKISPLSSTQYGELN